MSDSYACNGTRSTSLALCVSQALAAVLAGDGPVRVSRGAHHLLVWRLGEVWRVVTVSMMPDEKLDHEFRDKVEQLLRDHG